MTLKNPAYTISLPMHVPFKVWVELEKHREFVGQRNRREAQWDRLFSWDWHNDRFSYYAETKRETLSHFAELRRMQRRDGLLKRFPTAGRALEASLRALSESAPC